MITELLLKNEEFEFKLNQQNLSKNSFIIIVLLFTV